MGKKEGLLSRVLVEFTLHSVNVKKLILIAEFLKFLN